MRVETTIEGDGRVWSVERARVASDVFTVKARARTNQANGPRDVQVAWRTDSPPPIDSDVYVKLVISVEDVAS